MDLRDARSLFAGKVVFLGATAEGVASNQPVAGIATRSPILNQRDAFELLSNGSLLRRGGTGILIEVIVAVVLVCIGIWFGRSQVSVVRIGGLLCLFCAVFSIAVLCCSVFGFVIRVAGIGVLVLGVWITWMMEGFCGIERARNRIRQAFSAYVDPSIVQKITEQSSIVVEGGENRSITVMFTDLRNFTQICEGEDPHGVVSDLNQYFTLASNVIFESKGTLDKYIGDAVMAFWGAPLDLPNRKQNALEAAFRLLEDFDTLKKEWKERGRRLAYTEIGIGIHDGNALVGNIGGKRRFNYTAVGDNVNLASRLESLCKRYGVRIVVSESTRTAEMSNLLRFLDTVRVHGKKEPVVIYTCLVPEHSAPEDVYREAFGRYQEGSFKDAEALFLDMKASYPNDPTVSVLLERCQLLAIAQELSWDGVWSWEK
jgi:adenylate cyclase